MGGQKKIRSLWRHYYQGTEGLIFVVDCNDAERFEIAAMELHALLSEDEMRDAIVLVFANKQDLPYAENASVLADKMDLHRLRHQWYVQPCSAISGDGLYEGLEWLSSALVKKG